MAQTFKSTRDIIIRTNRWSEAVEFYGSILGLPVSYRDDALVGFETGSICLYIEKGDDHGPVFEFLVRDIQAAKKMLTSSGCSVVEENPSTPRCYIQDPFGLVFNIGQDPNSK